MWKVMQQRDRHGGLRYVVREMDTGKEHGAHDCERWAQAVAAWLNEKEEAKACGSDGRAQGNAKRAASR